MSKDWQQGEEEKKELRLQRDIKEEYQENIDRQNKKNSREKRNTYKIREEII